MTTGKTEKTGTTETIGETCKEYIDLAAKFIIAMKKHMDTSDPDQKINPEISEMESKLKDLWDKIDPEEQCYADEQVLRMITYLK